MHRHTGTIAHVLAGPTCMKRVSEYLNLTVNFAERPAVEQGGQHTERCDEHADCKIVECQ